MRARPARGRLAEAGEDGEDDQHCHQAETARTLEAMPMPEPDQNSGAKIMHGMG